MTVSSDFLIIGGGIAGISAGALLAADASVTVLEAEDAIAHHATGRSAAMYIRNYGNATLRSLNAAAEPLLSDPGDLTDGPVLSPRGEMLVATEQELPDLDAYIDGAAGIERLDQKQALEICPILRPESAIAAAMEWDAQDIDVDRLFQGFARRLKSLGGQIMTKAQADTITRQGTVWHVETPQGTFEAPVLINAAGAWADEIAKLAGVHTIGLQPCRRTAAILPAPTGYDIAKWPLIASASEQWYCKPEAGTLLVSPADEDPVDPHDAYVDDMVLAEGLYRFEQAVTVEVTRVERSWAGLRSFAPDRTPVAGFAPDADGFFWLAGQGGYGIQTSPSLSRLTADLCLGNPSELPAETVNALSPSRFQA